jgi:hypothetical protein
MPHGIAKFNFIKHTINLNHQRGGCHTQALNNYD